MINISVSNERPIIDIGATPNRPRIDIGIPSGGQSLSASINGVKLRGSLTYLDLYLVKGNVNTSEHWNANPLYVPDIGEMVIYTDRRTVNGINYPGIKIGDGNAYLVDLPFIGDDLYEQIMGVLSNHINNSDIHVTTEEKEFWNNKLNCEVENGTLILNRL